MGSLQIKTEASASALSSVPISPERLVSNSKEAADPLSPLSAGRMDVKHPKSMRNLNLSANIGQRMLNAIGPTQKADSEQKSTFFPEVSSPSQEKEAD